MYKQMTIEEIKNFLFDENLNNSYEIEFNTFQDFIEYELELMYMKTKLYETYPSSPSILFYLARLNDRILLLEWINDCIKDKKFLGGLKDGSN